MWGSSRGESASSTWARQQGLRGRNSGGAHPTLLAAAREIIRATGSLVDRCLLIACGKKTAPGSSNPIVFSKEAKRPQPAAPRLAGSSSPWSEAQTERYVWSVCVVARMCERFQTSTRSATKTECVSAPLPAAGFCRRAGVAGREIGHVRCAQASVQGQEDVSAPRVFFAEVSLPRRAKGVRCRRVG